MAIDDEEEEKDFWGGGWLLVNKKGEFGTVGKNGFFLCDGNKTLSFKTELAGVRRLTMGGGR